MDSLRYSVQRITRNLPGPLHDLGVYLFGKPCYNSLLHDLDFRNTKCLKLAVSKALGIGIIAASSVVKVPQMLKLVQAQSADGVSFLSYLLETSAYLITLAYNVRNGFPFSTFGESALILGQNVVISVLVLNYSGRSNMVAALVAALAISVAVLFTDGVLSMKMLSYLQVGAGALGVASKVPQILTIWKEGGTGQLSAFAVFNYLAGSLSRIFTTVQEVNDKLILYSFIAAFVLNAVIALQMVYYWKKPTRKSKGKGRTTPARSRAKSVSTPTKSPAARRRN